MKPDKPFFDTQKSDEYVSNCNWYADTFSVCE